MSKIVLFFLQPFGVNQPGPYVMYTTVDSNGDLKNASGKDIFFKMPHHASIYSTSELRMMPQEYVCLVHFILFTFESVGLVRLHR